MADRRPADAPEDWLGQDVMVHVDRPMGSRHPRFRHSIYPINYGYVPGTRAADGKEIDAYILGLSGPVERVQGCCIAIVHRLNDVEDKLVISPDGRAFDDVQIRKSVDFQERYFEIAILR